MKLLVVHEAWRAHPLAWIHRAEAHGIADELRRAGHEVATARFAASLEPGTATLVLRLSDPVMFTAAAELSKAGVPYRGPGFEVMQRCYDKFAAAGLIPSSPDTALGTDAARIAFPVVVKPRRGSDSIGVRRYARAPIPVRLRNERQVVQRYIRGAEITVAVLSRRAGTPLHIDIPEDALYTFTRKYLLRPRSAPLSELRLAERVRSEALDIAATMGVDWGARLDFIHEAGSGKLYFLECDVAPLVGVGSAFERSLSVAGVDRALQCEQLFGPRG